MTGFTGTIRTLTYGSAELKVIQDRCGVIAEHGLDEVNVSAVYMHKDNKFTYFLTFISVGHKRDFESDCPHLKEMWSSTNVDKEKEFPMRWPFAMATCSNPWTDEAEYHCGSCGIELDGEMIGLIAAGTNYANGEWAPCPQCGKDNYIDRGEEDD